MKKFEDKTLRDLKNEEYSLKVQILKDVKENNPGVSEACSHAREINEEVGGLLLDKRPFESLVQEYSRVQL